MAKKILLLVVLIIFFISSLTLGLIIFYLDPYRNELLSNLSFGLTFTLSITSFFTLLLYFFKNVYYRGEIFLSCVFSSLRQGFLIAIFFLGLIFFYKYGIFNFQIIILLFIILIFIESIFQNM